MKLPAALTNRRAATAGRPSGIKFPSQSTIPRPENIKLRFWRELLSAPAGQPARLVTKPAIFRHDPRTRKRKTETLARQRPEPARRFLRLPPHPLVSPRDLRTRKHKTEILTRRLPEPTHRPLPLPPHPSVSLHDPKSHSTKTEILARRPAHRESPDKRGRPTRYRIPCAKHHPSAQRRPKASA